jgi:hypothetical protein
MNKEFKSLNVRQFKLINGDDILALVNSKEDDKVVVERPVSIKTNMLGGYQLIPWFPFSQQTIYIIADSDILAHVEIDLDVKETYVKAVTATSPRTTTPKILSEDELSAEYEDLMNEIYDEDLATKKVIH